MVGDPATDPVRARNYESVLASLRNFLGTCSPAIRSSANYIANAHDFPAIVSNMEFMGDSLFGNSILTERHDTCVASID